MDQIVINDLHACINCLGSLDEGVFIKDIDTNVSIRDILRHLRRETNKCEIRLELGNMNVIEKCLIPLLRYGNEDSTLFDLLIRLMMNLTQPAFICFKQRLPDDMLMSAVYIKVDETLQRSKLLFANNDVLQILANSLTEVFEKVWEDRSEEEHMSVERVLILVRNILHINTHDIDGQTIDKSWSHHDRLVKSMMDSGWTELLGYLANTDDEHRFAFHTLEIVSLIFKEQNVLDSYYFESELLRLSKLEEELQNKESARLNLRALRYGGMFELPNVKSSSGLPMVYHHDLSSGTVDLRRDRNLRKKPKNRRPIDEKICERQSPEPVLEKLQEFCKMFLENGYGTLMSIARNYLVRQQMQPDDETYYLWSLKFFTSVCRLNGLSPEFVSETVNHEVFHWVYEQAIQYLEMGETDKKTARASYRKLQLAISAYNELLKFLLMLDKHKDTKYRSLSMHIKGSVFYREEYMTMYPTLLHKFKESVQSRVLLRDLIEGSNLIMRILEHHKSFDMNVVRKLKKKRKASKKKTPKVTAEGVDDERVMPNDDKEELDRIWDRINDVIISAVNGNVQIPDDLSLPCIYDATLPDDREPIEPGSEPVDVQLKKALGIVQIYLRQEKSLEAVAVLRLARTMWPDEERIALSEFEDSIEQEISMLKTLLLAPKFYVAEDLKIVEKDSPMEEDNLVEDDNDDEAEFADEEFESKEVIFDLNEYMCKFMDPNIVKGYGILFDEIFTNPPSTNSSLLRLMHRIALKMRFPVVLYQLRLFRAFAKFLKDPRSNTTLFKDERKFVVYMMKMFIQHTTENRKLFLEMLFSKNPKHLASILSGEKIAVEKSQIWTEALDQELERLMEELRLEEPLPGCDLVSMMGDRFSDPSKTRRQIIIRLIHLGLIDSLNDIKTKRKKMYENPWSVDEQSRLIVLFDEYKDEPNAIRFIMNGMKAAVEDPSMARTQRSVVKKLLELGLVDDKTELGIKIRTKKNAYESESENEQENEERDYEEMDGEEERHRVARVPPPLKSRKIVDWTAFKMTFARLSENERNWFVELLVDNIDTRANGIIGPLVLVPLLDEDSASLACKDMQKLLGICNFLYPNSSAGESFWRIPEDMGAKELEYFRNCAVSLTEDDLRALTMSSREEDTQPVTIAQSSEGILQKKTLNIRELLGSDSEENESEDERRNVGEFVEMKTKTREGKQDEEELGNNIGRNKNAMMDSEDEDDKENMEELDDDEVMEDRSERKKRKENSSGRKKSRLFESDEDDEIVTGLKNKRRLLESDEESDLDSDSGPLHKKKKLITEDSD